MIKEIIQDWLGITQVNNTITWIKRNNTENYEDIDRSIAGLRKDLRDAKASAEKFQNMVTAIDERLRPDLRMRLEQCKSAMDIQVKFLNEIYYEVKNQK